MSTIINYNMTRDYCQDWTATEAVREIVQNAIDTGCDYLCKLDGGAVSVISKGATLSPSSFALGHSVKKTAYAIGKYGEGFKIAMLVLTRLGLEPVIHSGNYQVRGAFMRTEFADVETFHLIIDETEYIDGVYFHCHAPEDTDTLKKHVTALSGEPLPSKVPEGVQRLEGADYQGKIFVSGLYVCENDDLTYGYNFAPSHIELNRDRNMVNGIEYQLAQYYGSLDASSADTVFNLVENEARDVAWLSWNISNNGLRAELARLFYNKYGDGAEIKQTTGYYGGSVLGVSCSSDRYSTYRSCGVAEATPKLDPKSPCGQLTAFFNENKKRMRRDLRIKFDMLVKGSKSWRN